MSQSKQTRYEESLFQLKAVLEGIDDQIAIMATISCILKTNHPSYYWVGFYRVVGGSLLVGPYQGSLGCLRIEFGRGVCGTCASTKETKIVRDVQSFAGHIVCDPRSKSEIVVPVLDKQGSLIAVLDVDSEDVASFDKTDQICLEKIIARFFG